MAIGSGAPKAPGGGIKQMKGPGMNLGLKKPRKANFIPKPKPFKQARSMTNAMSADTSSYLPDGQVGKPKKGKSSSYL